MIKTISIQPSLHFRYSITCNESRSSDFELFLSNAQPKASWQMPLPKGEPDPMSMITQSDTSCLQRGDQDNQFTWHCISSCFLSRIKLGNSLLLPSIVMPLLPIATWAISHLMTLVDLSIPQIQCLIKHLHHLKHNTLPRLALLPFKKQTKLHLPLQPLFNKTIALLFSKQSTCTQLAAETGPILPGGGALFQCPELWKILLPIDLLDPYIVHAGNVYPLWHSTMEGEWPLWTVAGMHSDDMGHIQLE